MIWILMDHSSPQLGLHESERGGGSDSNRGSASRPRNWPISASASLSLQAHASIPPLGLLRSYVHFRSFASCIVIKPALRIPTSVDLSHLNPIEVCNLFGCLVYVSFLSRSSHLLADRVLFLLRAQSQSRAMSGRGAIIPQHCFLE